MRRSRERRGVRESGARSKPQIGVPTGDAVRRGDTTRGCRVNLLGGLNPAQHDAVTTTEGPLLVLAGAGTGKTRVITTRVAHLLGRGVPPERILAVTFTNKAAREMRERVASLLGKAPKGLTLSTFHSLGMRILRAEATHYGYRKSFSIHDTSDQVSLVRGILRDTQGEAPTGQAQSMLQRISGAKNRFELPDDILDGASDIEEYTTARVYARYQESLKALNCVDFDDLILVPVLLLKENPEIAEQYRHRWDYVLVDEYQDTNGSQYRFLQCLVGPQRNLCVVGDDDQSIYGFRGADANRILQFERDFPGAKVVKLEENYRSTPPIIELANAVISGNRGRHDKALRSNMHSGTPVRCVTAANEFAEVDYVVREIDNLLRHHRVRPENIAVLYRSAIQARPFEEKLRLRQIPYVLVGGQSFFDRKEIRDVLAYWKVAANPSDDVALLRIINSPKRGIGTQTIKKLDTLSRQREESMFDAAGSAGEGHGDFSETVRKRLREFHLVLSGAREGIEEGKYSATAKELLKAVQYEESLKDLYPDPTTRQTRWNAVADLLAALEAWDAERNANDEFGVFLRSLTLDQDAPKETDDAAKKKGVFLMTLHSAKGLEFPQVFLVGVEDDLLPHGRSVADGEKGIEEERRLFYVGITRARQHLTMTHAAERTKYGRATPCRRSRFLEEIAGEVPLEEGSHGTSTGGGDIVPEEELASFIQGLRDKER